MSFQRHALKARSTASILNELLLLRLEDGTLPPLIHEVMPRINAVRGFIRSNDIIPATVGSIPMPDGSLVILTALVVCDTGSLLAVVATTPKDYHHQLLIDTYQAFCNRRGLGSSSNLKFQLEFWFFSTAMLAFAESAKCEGVAAGRLNSTQITHLARLLDRMISKPQTRRIETVQDQDFVQNDSWGGHAIEISRVARRGKTRQRVLMGGFLCRLNLALANFIAFWCRDMTNIRLVQDRYILEAQIESGEHDVEHTRRDQKQRTSPPAGTASRVAGGAVITASTAASTASAAAAEKGADGVSSSEGGSETESNDYGDHDDAYERHCSGGGGRSDSAGGSSVSSNDRPRSASSPGPPPTASWERMMARRRQNKLARKRASGSGVDGETLFDVLPSRELPDTTLAAANSTELLPRPEGREALSAGRRKGGGGAFLPAVEGAERPMTAVTQLGRARDGEGGGGGSGREEDGGGGHSMSALLSPLHHQQPLDDNRQPAFGFTLSTTTAQVTVASLPARAMGFDQPLVQVTAITAPSTWGFDQPVDHAPAATAVSLGVTTAGGGSPSSVPTDGAGSTEGLCTTTGIPIWSPPKSTMNDNDASNGVMSSDDAVEKARGERAFRKEHTALVLAYYGVAPIEMIFALLEKHNLTELPRETKTGKSIDVGGEEEQGEDGSEEGEANGGAKNGGDGGGGAAREEDEDHTAAAAFTRDYGALVHTYFGIPPTAKVDELLAQYNLSEIPGTEKILAGGKEESGPGADEDRSGDGEQKAGAAATDDVAKVGKGKNKHQDPDEEDLRMAGKRLARLERSIAVGQRKLDEELRQIQERQDQWEPKAAQLAQQRVEKAAHAEEEAAAAKERAEAEVVRAEEWAKKEVERAGQRAQRKKEKMIKERELNQLKQEQEWGGL